MSLIVCVFVGEGIVLASDSRSTYNRVEETKEKKIQTLGIHTTDTTYKTFLCPNNIGISVCGEVSIDNKPMTGYIEAFIREQMGPDTDIDTVPEALIQYFNTFKDVPNSNFFVAGYKKVGSAVGSGRPGSTDGPAGTRSPSVITSAAGSNSVYEKRLWNLNIKSKKIKREGTENQGASWSGEVDVLARLLSPAEIRKPDGTTVSFKAYDISWNYFTLQDAVDFAEFAIRTTVDTMKVQNRLKTVGGPIDILILKPGEAYWLQRKVLSV
ncbi:hypothetical protein [Acidaminobacter hydrogenoformans]|uniref:Uncharacterized protein n=1 Tax=Acidaminobacter hydrogenoformans DSM 2784 TaxID=1120920 RepID=A0A1G5RVS7_9FIRM|nr:hypothetical protein [Acidaminobacter hydrogenoformans]SCZ78146.1 hypothetical protein SAMN03080599_01105 [Acidaminobacter hydrogenoformans DSM 2784]